MRFLCLLVVTVLPEFASTPTDCARPKWYYTFIILLFDCNKTVDIIEESRKQIKIADSILACSQQIIFKRTSFASAGII